ncbi:MAG: tRNA (adenosine(37)-N6)-threonylcarbamoyltransferase complex transferase subunit TsaD [Candidatus Brocadiia bacterium]
MLVMAFETSCDDTSCAIVEDGRQVLSNIVSDQDELHERFGGIVPEVACRAHIENILPVMRQAIDAAEMKLSSVDAVAVTNTPGLIGSLLIGLTAAKAVSWAFDLPLATVNHLEAHSYAPWLNGEPPPLPAIGLVVSGGHTNLSCIRGPLEHELLGATRDDAAGEAFDKVANILKLGFPGGPVIEKTAENGDPEAVNFPRAWLNKDTLDFSFSGVKTAVLYHCLGQNASKDDIEDADYDPDFVANVAASFQKAVVDVLIAKTKLALEKTGLQTLIVGGGVAANKLLRQKLKELTHDLSVDLFLAPLKYCRDNAAIVGGLAYHLLKAKNLASLDAEAQP